MSKERINPETGVLEEKTGVLSHWTPVSRSERVDSGFGTGGSSHGEIDWRYPESGGQTSRTHTGAVRTSIMTRMERWLWRSLDRMTDEEVLRAVEAQSPAETIAEILAATPEPRIGSEADWAELLLRGADAKSRIVELVGGLLTSSEAAAILKITVPGVKLRMERRKLLAVPLPGGQWGFPALQFADGGHVRSGVPEVAKAGARIDPWVVLSILVDDAPDGSGMLLERLDDPAVLRDALHRLETYGEHVAA